MNRSNHRPKRKERNQLVLVATRVPKALFAEMERAVEAKKQKAPLLRYTMADEMRERLARGCNTP